MFNTLYNIISGIALMIGALGASDDFDGAQLVQNAFFGPEDELEVAEEPKMATEDVLVVEDVNEWNDAAAEVMVMSLNDKDEMADDEKLEIAVLTEENSNSETEKLEEDSQIGEKTQSGLSDEEFYSILERQFNAAMEDLASIEIADSEPVIIEAIDEQMAEDNLEEELVNVELQPEDDVNAEKALEMAQSEQSIEVEVTSENIFKPEKPWVVVHGLPDIPDEDVDVMINQPAKEEQPVKEEHIDIEDVNVGEIPVMEFVDVDVPNEDVLALEDIEAPLFVETEEAEAENADVEEAETEEAEAENADVEEAETEEAEAENADVEEAETEEAEAENADVEEAETEEAEAENADVEEAETEEAEAENADVEEELGIETEDDDLDIGPLEDDAAEVESTALVIPSLEIPPAVLTEEQRAKINAEVDAIANQNDNFDGWMPRQIPVSGVVEETQPQTKPENDFIQEFSRQNVKESILENTGIDLND